MSLLVPNEAKKDHDIDYYRLKIDEYDIKYDDTGRVISVTVSKGSILDYRNHFTYVYDDKTRIIKILSSDGKSTTSRLYEYDDLNRIIEIIEFNDAFVSMKKVTKYTYDDNGCITGIIIYKNRHRKIITDEFHNIIFDELTYMDNSEYYGNATSKFIREFDYDNKTMIEQCICKKIGSDDEFVAYTYKYSFKDDNYVFVEDLKKTRKNNIDTDTEESKYSDVDYLLTSLKKIFK